MNLEEQLILRASAFPRFNPAVLLGIEDDAAMMQFSASDKLIWAVDTMVENTHFLRAMPAFDIGWKALAVNLSDLAAMNANPVAALLSLSLPSDISQAWIEGFFNGLEACCIQYRVDLAGGDTVRQSSEINISISVLGKSSVPLFRKNARKDDLLVVTGTLGASAAGLYTFQQGLNYPDLIQSHLRPEPRFEEASELAGFSDQIALMDISDGLTRSLQLLCQVNGLGCLVDRSKLPISSTLLTSFSEEQYWPWVLNGGEEYELLAAVPAAFVGALENSSKFTVIGQLTANPSILIQKGSEQELLNEAVLGYQHF